LRASASRGSVGNVESLWWKQRVGRSQTISIATMQRLIAVLPNEVKLQNPSRSDFGHFQWMNK
jgi:hypothetical protein